MDLDELLSQADPTRDTPPPSGTSAQAQWTYTQITHSTPRRLPSYVRLRPVFTVVMSLGLVVAISTLLIGSHQPPRSAGADVLRHAAALVAAETGLQPAPGQYLYTETRSLYQATIYQRDIASGSLVPTAEAQYFETEETWTDFAGIGTGLLTRSPLQYSSSSDQAAWLGTKFGRDFSTGFAQSVSEPSLTQSVPNLSALSTDPTQLAHELATGSGGTNVDLIPNGPSAVFQRAARLLVGPDSALSPSLTSSLYQVLANQPGVTLLGEQTDHRGRAGVAVSVSDQGGVSLLIINPKSGLPLEVQYSPHTGAPISSLGGSTYQCIPVPECGSTPETGTPQGTAVTVGPTWTDTVSSQIVASPGARGSITAPIG